VVDHRVKNVADATNELEMSAFAAITTRMPAAKANEDVSVLGSGRAQHGRA
jgi:hypothetical protein